MAFVMMDLVQRGRGHHLSEQSRVPEVKRKVSKYPHQSVQRMAKPTVCIKRNHFQTVCTSKDKAQSRNTSRSDENKVYDDKSSAGDENHTFSLSTRQSFKNQPFFK